MKKYTKRQILESIRYWKKKLNESTNSSLSESYTRKQILDTIDYWCNKAHALNESKLPYPKKKIFEACVQWQENIRLGKFKKTNRD